MKSDEREFLDKVKRQLDDHAKGMDHLTASRLQAARKNALAQKTRAVPVWLPISGFATATAVLIAVALWFQNSNDFSPQFSEDWELLASGEELELIEELEFYNWLELMHGES